MFSSAAHYPDCKADDLARTAVAMKAVVPLMLRDRAGAVRDGAHNVQRLEPGEVVWVETSVYKLVDVGSRDGVQQTKWFGVYDDNGFVSLWVCAGADTIRGRLTFLQPVSVSQPVL